MDICSSRLGSNLRLLIVDDHQLVAQGVCSLLRPHFSRLDIVNSGEDLLATLVAESIDLVISDIAMGGISGIEAMHRARAAGLRIPFIFLTMHCDSRVAAEAIRAGASGYLLKSAAGEELLRAIHEVSCGRTFVSPTMAGPALRLAEQEAVLTSKQRRILYHLAQGLRSKQIAYELGISVRTVESHKYAMMQIMGVHGTVELIRKAEHLGLIPDLLRTPGRAMRCDTINE